MVSISSSGRWCGCALIFFFQAEDGIRDYKVTGVQTCALPISVVQVNVEGRDLASFVRDAQAAVAGDAGLKDMRIVWGGQFENQQRAAARLALEIGRASCRERV